jgi:hypothetical protein
MSDLDFYRTRAGRTYFEVTLPSLVTAINRLAAALEQHDERDGELDSGAPEPRDDEP